MHKIKQMRLKATLLAATVAAMTAVPALGQARFGIKGGIAINKLHFDKTIISSENRTGFTGGLQVDFALPVTGLSLDASLMYTHRNDALTTMDETYKREYVEIPVHVKYGLTIFGLNKLLVPYAFTGPNFSFLFSEGKQTQWENRASNTAWDVGFGAELGGHLQVQASYSIGITKSFKKIGITEGDDPVSGRDKCWTLTAAYLF